MGKKDINIVVTDMDSFEDAIRKGQDTLEEIFDIMKEGESIQEEDVVDKIEELDALTAMIKEYSFQQAGVRPVAKTKTKTDDAEEEDE